MSKSSVRYGKGSFQRSRLALGVASAVALFSANSFAAAHAVEIDIDAQRTDKALLELAEEVGVQIVFSPGVAKKSISESVQGDMSITSALEQLLKGTNLTYEVSGDKTYVVSEQEDDEGADDDVDEEIVVTGSAIRNVPPTSQVKVYTAEDIEKLGVSSTEDFIRKLPQNFSGLNSFTTTNGRTQDDNGGNRDAVGASAANLSGIGNDATLILINNRRTAESAVFEGGVVNLASIPLSSIERVEILLDGASARYGADAIGGVINFITKKDYVGAETSLRYETGRNGRNGVRLSQTLGYNWGSGGLTASLVYQEQDPVDTAKLGIDNFDHTARGGYNYETATGGADFDFRTQFPLNGRVFEASDNQDFCQSILVFGFSCEDFGIDPFEASRGDLLGHLPLGNDGTSWTAADLSPDNLAIGRFLERDQGVFTETKSFNLSVNQEVTDSLELYTQLSYTVNNSTNSGSVQRGTSVLVPESNAFNNFGGPVFVEYTPFNETISGAVPYTRSDSESARTDINVGFNLDLQIEGDWELRGNLGYSEDASEGGGIDGAFIEPSPFVRTRLTPEYQARYARFLELVSSSDPNEALNLFGDGSAQSPFLADVFGPSYANNPKSLTKSAEIQADGAVFSMPAGEARLGLGVEYRKTERDYSDDILRTNDGVRNDGFQFTEEPSREEKSFFAQLNLPIIGEGNSLPGIQALEFEVSARYDEYGINDSFAVVGIQPNDDVIYEPTGQSKFDHVSPRFGLRWQVVDDITLRASWTEAFRAPNFIELLGSSDGNIGPRSSFTCVFDENDPRPLGSRDPDPFDPTAPADQTCFIGFLSVANPDLKPEISTITSFGLEWTPSYVDGLAVKVDFRRTDFTDRIAQNRDALPEGSVFNQPYVDAGFFERDPVTGRIDYIYFQSLNFASREVEVVDFQVDYNFSTDLGDFRAGFEGVYTGTYNDQFGPINPVTNRVGTNRGPEQWRGRTFLEWSRDSTNVNLMANYSGSYHNFQCDPAGVADPDEDCMNQSVSSYVTIDLTASYEFSDGWRVLVGADNLTNKLSPFYNSRLGYDPRVYNPTGRFVHAEIKKSFDF